MKTLERIAHILSALLIITVLLLFLSYGWEGQVFRPAAQFTGKAVLQIGLIAFGLMGLALAWRRELAGGTLALISFLILFMISPEARVLIMLVFPLNAVLFLIHGAMQRKHEHSHLAH